MKPIFALLTLALAVRAEDLTLAGLEKPVEIIRDRWGVPHIYAETSNDLFFAQGWITARDRLFQIDLWRRVNNGHLAAALGPSALPRDRFARLVRFRGDWNAEWAAYGSDARAIATAFTSGINAYIRSLGGTRPLEFRLANYDPALWAPEDVTGRIAGLLMTRNLTREVQRVEDIRRFGLETVQSVLAPDPPVPIQVPKGLNLADISLGLLRDYNAAIGSVNFPEVDQGSNNWVVTGSRSVTRKPLLASDPHRPVLIPSLRKTVHLVGPGWNVIGAGEPALPGIALGHNEEMGFGFTIVGIDQGDLYVEKLNPADPNQYFHKGSWRKMEVVREPIAVRGLAVPRTVELRYTIHGPVIAEDLGRHRAYALKWVGSDPGGAGYLAALRLSRSKNWTEFKAAAAQYLVPSENMLYADRAGNIGWIASGAAPVRKNWNGLLPVPGDTGEYEWSGYLTIDQHPQLFNPPDENIATANHNILPPGYPHALGYEWAPPFRIGRVRELLGERVLHGLDDFQRMQQDVLSHQARLFQAAVGHWSGSRPALSPKEAEWLSRIQKWDCRLTVNSAEALVYEIWFAKLHGRLFGPALGGRADAMAVLARLERMGPREGEALGLALGDALQELVRVFGADASQWRWGQVHTITFRHPLNRRDFHRGPVERPGDGTTVNATSGSNYRQTAGASYRMILDTSDWDKSVMTNVPGESGDPKSKHYDNLLRDWASGTYHPMPYSRKAVEAAAEERMRLLPSARP